MAPKPAKRKGPQQLSSAGKSGKAPPHQRLSPSSLAPTAQDYSGHGLALPAICRRTENEFLVTSAPHVQRCPPKSASSSPLSSSLSSPSPLHKMCRWPSSYRRTNNTNCKFSVLAHFPLSAKVTIGRIWDKRLTILRYWAKSWTVGKLRNPRLSGIFPTYEN